MTAAGTIPALARIAPPSAIEVIHAAEVAARIEAAHTELLELERELAEARAEADALEEAGETTLSTEVCNSVTIRFVQFLDALRAEANDEIGSLVEVAAAHDRRRRAVRMSWAPVVSAPRVDGAPAGVEMRWLAHGSPPEATTAGVEPVRAESPADPVAQPPAPPRLDLEPFAPPAPTHMDRVDNHLESEFWSDEPTDGGNRLFRVVRTVAFQAVAVLLVLFVILLRIG